MSVRNTISCATNRNRASATLVTQRCKLLLLMSKRSATLRKLSVFPINHRKHISLLSTQWTFPVNHGDSLEASSWNENIKTEHLQTVKDHMTGQCCCNTSVHTKVDSLQKYSYSLFETDKFYSPILTPNTSEHLWVVGLLVLSCVLFVAFPALKWHHSACLPWSRNTSNTINQW